MLPSRSVPPQTAHGGGRTGRAETAPPLGCANDGYDGAMTSKLCIDDGYDRYDGLVAYSPKWTPPPCEVSPEGQVEKLQGASRGCLRMAGWSWRHLLCRNEPEHRSPYGCRKRGPGGDDHCQVRIHVHAPCTLVVHTGVLFVYIWCIRRGIVGGTRRPPCTDLLHLCMRVRG